MFILPHFHLHVSQERVKLMNISIEIDITTAKGWVQTHFNSVGTFYSENGWRSQSQTKNAFELGKCRTRMRKQYG